jgi:TRAP-type C4-dicarboxylate transport system permease small subunit
LKRFNDGLARGEAALAMGMLLLMIVVAFAQALLRNLTNLGVTWANTGLAWLDWADFILSKGTLWLAFLGASLAVHGDKHVAIDALPKLVSPRARVTMRAVVSVIGSVICFYLARAFWSAVLINGEERPPEYDILTADGASHVCDVSDAGLSEAGAHRGALFCFVRGFFAMLGVRMETPGAAFQLIVPVMFMFMSARMLGMGIHELLRLSRGDVADDPAAHGLTGAANEVRDDADATEQEKR